MPQSITDILREHNIRYVDDSHRNVRTGWVGIEPCPWCGPGGSHGGANLGINLNGLYASCWRCGPKRLSEVFARLGVPHAATRRLKRDRTQDTRIPHTGRYTPPQGVCELQKRHRQYLRGRGFDPTALVKLWSIGGIGISHNGLSWRVFIPVHQHGTPVTWTSRSTSQNETHRKYHTATPSQSSVPPSDVLYGVDYVRHAAVVVEGPADVWAVGPGAVCTLGLSYSRAQLLQLSRYSVGAVCYDSEPQAQRRANELVDELSLFGGQWSNIVLDANDPGSADKCEIELLRKEVFGW